MNSVSLSADGMYITAGSDDKNVYTFKNSLADRPSIIPYGPRSGSEDVTDPILRWFAGSDDRSNLTFDLYLAETDSNAFSNGQKMHYYDGKKLTAGEPQLRSTLMGKCSAK